MTCPWVSLAWLSGWLPNIEMFRLDHPLLESMASQPGSRPPIAMTCRAAEWQSAWGQRLRPQTSTSGGSCSVPAALLVLTGGHKRGIKLPTAAVLQQGEVSQLVELEAGRYQGRGRGHAVLCHMHHARLEWLDVRCGRAGRLHGPQGPAVPSAAGAYMMPSKPVMMGSA